MARSGWSTSNYLSGTSAVASNTYPFTFSAWFNCSSVTGSPAIVAFCDSTSARCEGALTCTTGSALQAINVWTTFSSGTTTTSTFSLNKWNHAAGVFPDAHHATPYLNGATSGSNTDSGSGSISWNNLSIGALKRSTVSQPFNGSLGEVAAWNVSLTAAEIAALATGVPAYLIRPASIVGYWPVYGLASPEPDFSGKANNMSITGSLSEANGPSIVPFSAPFWKGNYPYIIGSNTFNVSLSELASPSDLFSETATFPVTISESMTITDKPSEVKVIVLTITETVSLSDTYSEVATFAAAIAEAAIATDTPTEVGVFTVSVAEAAQASDSNVVPVGVSKSLSEIASISDAFTQTTVPAPIKPYLAPPFFIEDSKQHRRILTEAVQALYRGKGPVPIDNFTLNANATSTTLYDPRIGWYSHVAFMPQTANAASLASSIYVPQSQMINGQLTVMHSSTTDTDCTFRVILWG